MAGPLLTTKLHVPRRRRGAVARPRLTERLRRGAEGPLTLVSAPAGFGKSTVLTEWLAADGRTAAWVSLDQRDGDPVLFWTYVLSALRTTYGLGAGALAALEAHAPVDAVLATLVNELAAAPDDVVLVLDDHHLVESRDVQEGVAFLLEHLPPHVHLVIATRADPPLPLARLRARGDLVEVRADDLRFTADEAAAYLAGATGRQLPAEHVAALEGRTEGWIAALQLAALSMRGREDVAGFVAGFAGHDRYVVDYLVEEVLQQQPDDVRDFLLGTSVLSRLSGPLCDAVLGRDGGTAVLEGLDRANLFLVPLDDRRHWYRYHHLFADVLHARLLAEQPDRVAGLHRRAAGWFAEHGEPAEAIRHALAGGDGGRAADLVEAAMPAVRRNRQETTLRAWFEALPDEVLRARPALGVTYAGTLVQTGEFADVAQRLSDAEQRLDAAPTADAARVRGEIALYRAALAQVRGDPPETVAQARRALELAGEEEHLLRGAAAGVLGLAAWSGGDLAAAHRWWSDSAGHLGSAGHVADTLGVAIALADISLAQGRLRRAEATYRRGLATATSGAVVLRGAADMHVGLADVLRERDDLAAARRHLAASRELGEHAGLPQNRHRWLVAMARVCQAEGDLAAAVDLLDEAEQLYAGDMFPDVRPIPAVRARVWTAQGRVGEALGWARERGLSPDDDPTYLREFEHVTLARALLAAGDVEVATRFVARLLAAAEAGERTGSAVELLVLQALARQAGGDDAGALDAIGKALALAEPEGHVRVFADEGRPLAALLRSCTDHGASPAYARRLLAAAATDGRAPDQPGLVEPLSARELDVLRLLGSDLDGPGIARALFVSVNTVRTHTKNIYAKLGVNSRRAAVRRAAELDLLARPPA
ncbi:LuxR C-terminal-related transcriptional regulator [Blastococcus sp. SYSU D00669]